jgi:hypothetical protein
MNLQILTKSSKASLHMGAAFLQIMQNHFAIGQKLIPFVFLIQLVKKSNFPVKLNAPFQSVFLKEENHGSEQKHME